MTNLAQPYGVCANEADSQIQEDSNIIMINNADPQNVIFFSFIL